MLSVNFFSCAAPCRRACLGVEPDDRSVASETSPCSVCGREAAGLSTRGDEWVNCRLRVAVPVFSAGDEGGRSLLKDVWTCKGRWHFSEPSRLQTSRSDGVRNSLTGSTMQRL